MSEDLALTGEHAEPEWRAGDRVTVEPITARAADGSPIAGYLVVRDPEGQSSGSSVDYGDEPGKPKFATGGTIALRYEPGGCDLFLPPRNQR